MEATIQEKGFRRGPMMRAMKLRLITNLGSGYRGFHLTTVGRGKAATNKKEDTGKPGGKAPPPGGEKASQHFER
jgi:hypothetical protein